MNSESKVISTPVKKGSTPNKKVNNNESKTTTPTKTSVADPVETPMETTPTKTTPVKESKEISEKDKLEMSQIPCSYQAKGLCNRGSKCWFKHDPEITTEPVKPKKSPKSPKTVSTSNAPTSPIAAPTTTAATNTTPTSNAKAKKAQKKKEKKKLAKAAANGQETTTPAPAATETPKAQENNTNNNAINTESPTKTETPVTSTNTTPTSNAKAKKAQKKKEKKKLAKAAANGSAALAQTATTPSETPIKQETTPETTTPTKKQKRDEKPTGDISKKVKTEMPPLEEKKSETTTMRKFTPESPPTSEEIAVMKKIPCTHYGKGNCRNGDSCWFNHDIPVNPEPIEKKPKHNKEKQQQKRLKKKEAAAQKNDDMSIDATKKRKPEDNTNNNNQKKQKSKPFNPQFDYTPTLHEEAAVYLEHVQGRKGSLRSLVLDNCINDRRAIYAILCECLKKSDAIDNAIQESKLLEENPSLPPLLAKVIAHDVIFGKSIRANGVHEKTVMKYTSALQSAYEANPATENTGPALFFRYARVNTIKKSVQEVVQYFQQQSGYQLINQVTVHDKGRRVFAIDPLFKDLLVFPPGTRLFDHPLKNDDTIYFQDKASCLPVMAVNPQPGWTVMDACAAPGNKTAHMAALMKNNGKIYAFDMDQGRCNKMKITVKNAGASIIECQSTDFLSVKHNDKRYSQVKAVLVDPSCSGSGTVFYHETTRSLEELHQLQVSLVLHAMKFPNVERVVYSTCSVNQEENEDVVVELLEKQKEFKLVKAVPEWYRRGLPVFQESDKVIRTSPEEDKMIGFFVACFEKK